MMIHVCDGCGEHIIGNSYVTIGVPDGMNLNILDMCGTSCVLQVLEMTFEHNTATVEAWLAGEDDVEPQKKFDTEPMFELPLELPEHLREALASALTEEQEPAQLRPVPQQPKDPEAKHRRSPEESLEAEKRFKKQASELTRGQTEVKRRGYQD